MMKSSLIQIKRGDTILYQDHIDDWVKVKFLESVITPNGINNPELISVIYAQRPNGNTISATSDKFKPCDDRTYDAFFPTAFHSKFE